MPLSPMMKHYMKTKEEYPGCLLMYRLGDFYELFFDDAKIASRELELTLTGRACGMKERAPMCGVPYHSADTYIARLVERGYKVAICEQMEDPAEAKGLVKREVRRVVTPGTLDLSGATKNDENLYIASVHATSHTAAIAYADVTTGEIACMEMDHGRDIEPLISELTKLAPKEILYDSSLPEDIVRALKDPQINSYLNPVDTSYYRSPSCVRILKNQFHAASMIALDIDGKDEMIRAAGSLLLYLTDTEKQSPAQFTQLRIYEPENHMQLDRSTIRNLELLETLYDKKTAGSLLGVLDKTHTAMGARLLKRFIKEPLNDSGEINKRLNAVDALSNDTLIRNDLVDGLKKIYDFQRLTTRVASGRANGKDLIALKKTLEALPDIVSSLNNFSPESELLDSIRVAIDDFSALYQIIDDAVVEDPPFLITEGELIKSGYSEELDSLKDSIQDAKEWIATLEQTERERTGIKSIKVGYNKVFGYYIDVSKSFIDQVPDNYVRKQTLVNNERYITPELKEKEGLVLSAEAKINALEYNLFCEVRKSIEPYIESLQKASSAIALLDVLVSFAVVAAENGYVRPEVDDSGVLEIRKGRHPSVEKTIGDGLFVANDTEVDADGKNMLIITGPNMSGKSTYMRQTAIIVLMAQMGSFVPADSARIGVCDRVFTRIGASDNLTYGQSTFFIEMSELANILRNATRRSLIILDEIGRGTSTFDGLSIAWATIEYLCEEKHRVRTMFATHYHELTVLEDQYDCVRNLSVAVSEEGKDIVFLHRIVDGPASKSYGIHVAKIAGIPKEIRNRAQKKLKELESHERQQPVNEQISMFDPVLVRDDEHTESAFSDVIDRLEHMDLNAMTPIQALLALQEVQNDIREINEDIEEKDD